jgi:hypothetical protein
LKIALTFGGFSALRVAGRHFLPANSIACSLLNRREFGSTRSVGVNGPAANEALAILAKVAPV